MEGLEESQRRLTITVTRNFGVWCWCIGVRIKRLRISGIHLSIVLKDPRYQICILAIRQTSEIIFLKSMNGFDEKTILVKKNK